MCWWSTDRERFLGRGGSRGRPAALDDPERARPLPGAHHPLDPIAAAVLEVDLDPWTDTALTLAVAVAADRDGAIRVASEYRFPGRRQWARVQARARAEGELARLGAAGRDLPAWSELLSHVLHPRGMERAGVATAAILDLRQSTLWRWGISGDHPFILLEGPAGSGSPLIGDLIRAQRWWRSRGQLVDLVIAGHEAGEYTSPLRERVTALLSGSGAGSALGAPGGVHIIPEAELDEEERVRLRTLAAFRVDATGGPLGRAGHGGPPRAPRTAGKCGRRHRPGGRGRVPMPWQPQSGRRPRRSGGSTRRTATM